jgi:hypothetical protein
MKVKTLLIGLGNIAIKYKIKKNKLSLFTHCGSLLNNNFFTVIGAVDKSNKNRNLYKKFFNNNFFYDFKSIPKEINPELIVLSTTTKTHYKTFLKIFKHKFKNLKVILAEKPFCNTIEQANKIRYLSKKNNIKIFINYTRNYYKSFNIINKYFDKKKSNEGTVYYSGDFKNNASHFISLFTKFYGKINNIHILENNSKEKKEKKKYLLDFGNTNIFFQKINEKNIHKFTLHNKYFKLFYKNSLKSFFIVNKKINKKIMYNINVGNISVFEEIQNFFLKKKYYCCSVNNSIYVHQIIKKCIN